MWRTSKIGTNEVGHSGQAGKVEGASGRSTKEWEGGTRVTYSHRNVHVGAMYGGGGDRGVEKDSRERVCTKDPEIENETRFQIELMRKSREGEVTFERLQKKFD